eukprot:TRINITY_DN19571_c0_g1_i1.p1 TRINITY_DN19571_c0_g1~~TRINITY_DN19571_c0_g1_i1.p1  ORF type:complete len:379 (+),score=65.16 TRINITY_DN19571_c0_g1_i1:45-1181(+)
MHLKYVRLFSSGALNKVRVTGNQDVRRLLASPEQLLSAVPKMLPNFDTPQNQRLHNAFRKTLLLSQPREHALQRRTWTKELMSRKPAARYLEELKLEFSKIVTAVGQPGTLEMVNQVAAPFVASIVGNVLLGCPKSDHKQLIQWADVLEAYLVDPLPNPALAESTAREHLAAAAYFQAHLRRPGRSVLHRMAATTPAIAEDPDQAVALLMLLGAYHNTTRAVAATFAWVAQNGAAASAEIVAQAPPFGVVDEVLRLWPPPCVLLRNAAAPVSLSSGEVIAPGTVVLLDVAAANRDPEAFRNPEEFVANRPEAERARLVTFGRGPHRCLGAGFARMQMEVALHGVLAQWPRLKLADTPDATVWHQETSFQGFTRLLAHT